MAIDKTLGYEYIYEPDHYLANKSGKVYVHRIVASEKLGRWIATEEHVHHIDGNRRNNDPENLLIISASEHTKLELELRGIVRTQVFCSNCSAELYYYASSKKDEGLCQKCYHESTRRFNISKEELEFLVWKYPTTKVAKMFGISDNAISHRRRNMGITKPARGYWRKVECNKI